MAGLKSMFARITEELKACRHLRYRAWKSARQSTSANSIGSMADLHHGHKRSLARSNGGGVANIKVVNKKQNSGGRFYLVFNEP